MPKLELLQYLAGRVVLWLSRPPDVGGWILLGILACTWCAGWYFAREIGLVP